MNKEIEEIEKRIKRLEQCRIPLIVWAYLSTIMMGILLLLQAT